ncbi:hypothetical protein [Rhabdothermincola salaria]|uniref:hypothetical protein n=1 Tax=Rhabdothermincola salaria TaxID=2903142 RepID=UPI001E3C2B18|nr:hypothetical protein [Rhabdothermincola salaria]MCD9622699.1 hypothetical protein [Rhabdothermincola salaria]
MNKATLRTLSAADQDLLRETEPARLRELDEDDLLALHARIRRARNKYAKNYRRQAASRVTADKSRAVASKANQRTSAKAEVYEDALARVSRHLAKAARQSAEALKSERLAAARGQKGKGKGASASKGKGRAKASSAKKGDAKDNKKSRTPISKRSSASARSTTRRAQAKRAAK